MRARPTGSPPRLEQGPGAHGPVQAGAYPPSCDGLDRCVHGGLPETVVVAARRRPAPRVRHLGDASRRPGGKRGDPTDLAERFDTFRRTLRRGLPPAGFDADADDAVQESWLRLRAGHDAVTDLGGWLTTSSDAWPWTCCAHGPPSRGALDRAPRPPRLLGRADEVDRAPTPSQAVPHRLIASRSSSCWIHSPRRTVSSSSLHDLFACHSRIGTIVEHFTAADARSRAARFAVGFRFRPRPSSPPPSGGS